MTLVRERVRIILLTSSSRLPGPGLLLGMGLSMLWFVQSSLLLSCRSTYCKPLKVSNFIAYQLPLITIECTEVHFPSSWLFSIVKTEDS